MKEDVCKKCNELTDVYDDGICHFCTEDIGWEEQWEPDEPWVPNW